MKRARSLLGLATALATAVALSPAALGHPGDQHSANNGHLSGTGEWGKIQLEGSVRVADAEEGLIADVAVDPDGDYAYLARWGGAGCAGPEGDGPDGGVYIIDIKDLENPVEVGFIRARQDTLVGEGMQVVSVDTAKFSGDVLVMNHEVCGKNGKGGVSLWDVTDPLEPKKLSENFGDFTVDDSTNHPHVANQTHSAFLWQAGDNAYLVSVDDEEGQDVDIFDVTNPKKPVLIAELDLNQFDVDQPELGLTQSFLHDMVVKQVDGHWIMLLSYWDGGYVLLNVDDPADPTFLSDTDFAAIDPELLESTGISLTPEGNGHQAEFTSDNRFVIGTDEDFAPYRTGDFEIASGPNAGVHDANIVGGGAAPAILPDLTLNGPVVYGGYGCPDSAGVPKPESIPGYLESLAAGEESILVLQRGPVADPNAPEAACFPGEKAHEAYVAGWDAVLLVQRHVGAENDVPFCGSGAFVDEIVAVCTTHEAFHLMFNTEVSWSYPEEPSIGDVGERVSVESQFDGWGYVHLFARNGWTLTDVDTFAIDEAHDPAFAFGYGDLSVHEVATDPLDPSLAYLAYYSGGLRAVQIQCADPEDASTCELVEVGGYLDPDGNNFWGVETFVRDGQTIILASDRDSGLWVFVDP
ncbi:hypothetical protein OO014_13435 [Intrasporangium calvum]|uniref:LVIVD repeat-containing protein n=1 Tax=Intrasporangium calvum TaxID=53358 RepID=A0ABT5GJS8_9MICO|nr:hypothetical protein [Intrasporangium calvum]MDC5698261.1 hypothetical protein [Intrasporangium calvum]